MRTRSDCPAGRVTVLLDGAAGAGAVAACGARFDCVAAGAGGGVSGAAAGAGAADCALAPGPPVKVSATMSIVWKVCTSPLTSKRSTACVPPRYLPCRTRPSFNSKVSADAALANKNPRATKPRKCINLFISDCLSQTERGKHLRSGFPSPPQKRGPIFHSIVLDGGAGARVAEETRLRCLIVSLDRADA